MLELLKDDKKLGGIIEFPTVSRDDPTFNKHTGDYWRGAIWLPTSYMGIKSLEVYGFLEEADAIVVLSCGAGVQTVADSVPDKPVFPGLESLFLGNVIRHGVFEERCQMCGECVLDLTAGICPVTTCPKGLLNGPCGGMWEGRCEVLTDRECTHVRIQQRLSEQGRGNEGALSPKDFSKALKPGNVNLREDRKRNASKETSDE